VDTFCDPTQGQVTAQKDIIIIIFITTTTSITSFMVRVDYDIFPLIGGIFVFREMQVCGQLIFPSYNAIGITTLLIVR
jgi:hypothetical protein